MSEIRITIEMGSFPEEVEVKRVVELTTCGGRPLPGSVMVEKAFRREYEFAEKIYNKGDNP